MTCFEDVAKLLWFNVILDLIQVGYIWSLPKMINGPVQGQGSLTYYPYPCPQVPLPITLKGYPYPCYCLHQFVYFLPKNMVASHFGIRVWGRISKVLANAPWPPPHWQFRCHRNPFKVMNTVTESHRHDTDLSQSQWAYQLKRKSSNTKVSGLEKCKLFYISLTWIYIRILKWINEFNSDFYSPEQGLQPNSLLKHVKSI